MVKETDIDDSERTGGMVRGAGSDAGCEANSDADSDADYDADCDAEGCEE